MTYSNVMRLALWLGVTAAANRSTTVAALERRRKLGYVMTDSNIYTARDAWLANPTAAEATYGHISTWETGGVTDMSYLFCGYSGGGSCNTAAASFNEDIGAWDTSGVTTMMLMFYQASAFDQDLSGWAVHSVTDMWAMFRYASAFDQDLGWCMDDDVGLNYAFDDTPCESTSCGVNQGNCYTPAPSQNSSRSSYDDDDDDDSWKMILIWVAGVLGFICFLMLLPRSRPRTAAEAVERANRRSRVHVDWGLGDFGRSTMPPEWR